MYARRVTQRLKVILTAIQDDLATAWQTTCGDLPGVEVHRGDIFKTGADAVVSPANSFGFMDGGIDAVYTHVFGPGVQRRLQAAIRKQFHGELLVGQAHIVETKHQIPYLIAAPTMRVPMLLRDSVNPYLAARAVFLLIRHGVLGNGTPIAKVVKTVAFPGLGTGVGQVPPEVCGRQLRAAFEEVLLDMQTFPRAWFEAQARHQRLYRDQVVDLQFQT